MDLGEMTLAPTSSEPLNAPLVIDLGSSGVGQATCTLGTTKRKLIPCRRWRKPPTLCVDLGHPSFGCVARPGRNYNKTGLKLRDGSGAMVRIRRE
jgi:hypothetical protein